jgi:hypothetical protein
VPLFPGLITASVKKFADLSGIGESTIWRLVRERQLETIAIGRRRLIVVESFRRLIEAQRANPVPPFPMPRGRARGRPRRAAEAEGPRELIG